MPSEKKTMYKRKVYFKINIDDKGIPYFVWQKILLNTATKEDIKRILEDYWIDNEDLLEDFYNLFFIVDTQIRLAWFPSFFQQSVGDEFFEEFKKKCSKLSRWSVTIKDRQWVEKKWPIAMFSMYQYCDWNLPPPLFNLM